MAEPADSSPVRIDCTKPETWPEAADAARQAINSGTCIVLPTDTVYGIGADAFNADAVAELLQAKGRGRDMPPPVLIAEAALIRALAVEVPQEANDLMAKHWPGALTIICKAQPSLRMDLGDAEGTIALRVPDHALTREILRGTGPLAVSSANRSGQPPATSCDEAIEQLGSSVALYLDAGALGAPETDADSARAPQTRASSIVDFTQRESGELLRSGAIPLSVLRETCPDLADLTGTEPQDSDAPPVPDDGGE